MSALNRLIISSFAVVSLFIGAVLPAVVSADVYPYNCNSNDPVMYGSPYWNQNCINQGTLLVYVQTNNQQNTYPYRSPSDFTIFVSGASASQQYFQGSQNGSAVRMTGAYSVTVQNPAGYAPSYSSGCSGTVVSGQTMTCNITMNGTVGQYYPPTYYPPVYQQYQPVTYGAKFVPALPNTGFAPISVQSIALTLVLLIAAGVFTLQYVRKIITAIVR